MSKTQSAHSCADTSTTDSKRSSDTLTDYSPTDKPWDIHKASCDDVSYIYAGAAEFERYAARMSECSGVLRFAWSIKDKSTGEASLKLKQAQFCRVRHCPICQWRRSLMWQARFYQQLPKLLNDYPKARWLFLTLTVRNCDIKDLRLTITDMNKAWQRLKDRKEFKSIQGWIRTTEITRGKDGTAHPHFHALIMVPPSYFKKTYVSQARWVELWRDCMRLDYLPNVDVRAVKPRKDTSTQVLDGAIKETLKYSTKPSDMTASDTWFLELTRQTHKLRFIASGGTLKDVLKVEQESNNDLINTDTDTTSDTVDNQQIAFAWHESKRVYKRAKTLDT